MAAANTSNNESPEGICLQGYFYAKRKVDTMCNNNDAKQRLCQYGPGSLTNAELISMILRKGKRNISPLHVAETIDADYGSYRQLARCQNVDDLLYRYPITQDQALALLASMELGKRLVLTDIPESEHIASPADAAKVLMGRLRHETHERFLVVLLNTKNRIISIQQISEGSLTSAVVHPREVYAPAIISHAAAILVAHNHPSGDPYPSTDDKSLTAALSKAGDIIGIPLVDHLIVGDGYYYSFKEQNGV